jgi:hypothetical protein
MNRHLRRFGIAAAALAAILSLVPAASAVGSPRIYVGVPPPPVVVETRPPAPSPRHVWIDGYHRWDGHGYVWTPGTWRRAPRAHATWTAGHWVHGRRGWYWVGGRWR